MEDIQRVLINHNGRIIVTPVCDCNTEVCNGCGISQVYQKCRMWIDCIPPTISFERVCGQLFRKIHGISVKDGYCRVCGFRKGKYKMCCVGTACHKCMITRENCCVWCR